MLAERLSHALKAGWSLLAATVVWVATVNFLAVVLGLLAWAPLRHALNIDLGFTRAAAFVFVLMLAQSPTLILLAVYLQRTSPSRVSERG